MRLQEGTQRHLHGASVMKHERTIATVVFWLAIVMSVGMLVVLDAIPMYRAAAATERSGVVVVFVAAIATYVPAIVVFRHWIVDRVVLPMFRWMQF